MDIIKSSADISTLFTQGKRVHTSCVTFIVLPQQHDLTDSSCGRVAFIAGKKLGNAVWRNSAKRRMRAACREVGGPWDGLDVAMLAKGRITQLPYSKVIECFSDASEKLCNLSAQMNGNR